MARKLHIRNGATADGLRIRTCCNSSYQSAASTPHVTLKQAKADPSRVTCQRCRDHFGLDRKHKQSLYAAGWNFPECVPAHLLPERESAAEVEGPWTLRRDGHACVTGTYPECMAYIHRVHSFSLDWALKHEGYSIAPAVLAK